jgi:hypothetical protein
MMSQALKTTLTMALLGVVLVGAAMYGWNKLTAPLPVAEDPGPCSDVTVEKGQKIFPEMVTVSVLNAGTRSGLAGSTMELLTSKGFGEGEMGNLQADRKVKRVQVWVTEKPAPQATLVKSWLGKKVKVLVRKEDAAVAPGVVVVVGNNFPNELAKGRKSITPKREVTVCSPPEAPITTG